MRIYIKELTDKDGKCLYQTELKFNDGELHRMSSNLSSEYSILQLDSLIDYIKEYRDVITECITSETKIYFDL